MESQLSLIFCLYVLVLVRPRPPHPDVCPFSADVRDVSLGSAFVESSMPMVNCRFLFA